MKKLIIIFLISFLTISCGNSGEVKIKVFENNKTELYWDAPTTYSDGSPLFEPLGYKVYYGFVSRTYINVIDVGQVLTYDVSSNPNGTYYAVTAYILSNGLESDYSNEVRK